MLSARFFIGIFVISSCCGLAPVDCSSFLSKINNFFQNIAKMGVKVADMTLSVLTKVDPVAKMTTPEFIFHEGYAVQTHYVTTTDGYVLALHRIPGRPGSPAVFLQHGLLGSSFDWVMAGKNQSLAFILADFGYDVWMGNSRGNIYSRNHLSISVESTKFWTFDWHEMGVYDLPAAIGHISKMKNNDSLIYIGHSQGTTEFFVMASEKPDFTAEKIKAAFMLSPVVFMKLAISPLKVIAFEPLNKFLQSFFKLWSNREILPNSWIIKFFSKYSCEATSLNKEICANLLFAMTGFDREQFNNTLIPRILAHFPSGSSFYTLVHYSQLRISGKFQKFDHANDNFEKYNQTTPPEYDLSKVKVPVGLFWSENDWLSHAQDVERLSKLLPNMILYYKVPYERFNHLDFLWAIDAPKLVYKKLISTMQDYK